MTRRGRELRRRATHEEQLLWQAMRDRKLGHKIRRQHPLGNCVVDFFCKEAHVAIEIDGDLHDPLLDELRDAGLLGVKVVRFRNSEVRDNVFEVLARIKVELDLRVGMRGPSSPSPRTALR